jgi:hypothetical protein
MIPDRSLRDVERNKSIKNRKYVRISQNIVDYRKIKNI